VYWQVLLLACLFLPALQVWKQPVIVVPRATAVSTSFVIPNAAIPATAFTKSFNIPEIIGWILAGGILLRLIWLALGCFRLSVFLRNSRSLSALPPAVETLSSRIGVRARFFLSRQVDSPATFGVLSPTVILPHSFSGMSEDCREAVICHELLHVQRRDWAAILVEEIVRCIYWFHPAVWWLLGRIHLAREQSVDYEAVRLTGNRQPYLNSLLEIARGRGRPRAVPAPLFLKERHLVERVALLIKEVSMNRLRLTVSLTAIFILLAGTVHLASAWFPLTGESVVSQEQPAVQEIAPAQANPEEAQTPPEKARVYKNPNNDVTVEIVAQAPPQAGGSEAAPPVRSEPIKLGNNVMESRLIRRVAPIYPELAKRARVSGRVVLQIAVNETGDVTDTNVMSGHPLLNDAAVTAVKQWKYSPTLLNGRPVPVIATVTVVFMLDGSAMQRQQTVPPGEGSGIVGPVPDSTTQVEITAQSVEVHQFVRPEEIPAYYAEVVSSDGLGGTVSIRALARAEPSGDRKAFYAPELALDRERLHVTAEANWPPGTDPKTRIVYSLTIDEVSEIKDLKLLSGPDIPGVGNLLAKTGVVAPARPGSAPVASECQIIFRLIAQ
jgi:TonB family protein